MNIAKDKWMKYKGTSGRAVLTLCGVYGVAYLFSLQPVNRIYYSVLNVLLAVGIYSMLGNRRKYWLLDDPRRKLWANGSQNLHYVDNIKGISGRGMQRAIGS